MYSSINMNFPLIVAIMMKTYKMNYPRIYLYNLHISSLSFLSPYYIYRTRPLNFSKKMQLC